MTDDRTTTSAADPSLRQARARFLAANGLPLDGRDASSWWTCRIGRLRLRVYNFPWRRRAIPAHDVHHVLTGFECTLTGEMEMAAWEFAAGRFRHPGATSICLPLVLCGAVVIPGRTFSAFLRGRRSGTLYATGIDARLLDRPLGEIRDRLCPQVAGAPSLGDRLAYAGLLAKACLLVGIPFAGGLLGYALLAG